MTIYQKLKDALEELEIPVKEDFNGGGESEYITWTETGENRTLMADGEPVEDIKGVYVHWFRPREKKYSEMETRIRRMLLEAGFTWPKVTNIIEPDNVTRHIVFECEVENDID